MDLELGLTRDGFSIFMLGLALILATKVSYAQTVALLTMFLEWSPAQATIEESVLGFGKFTRQWFESAPIPTDDGEVQVFRLTVKQLLLQLKNSKKDVAHGLKIHKAQRHRGKAKRQRCGKKKLCFKGDKSKNGKMSTIVVMYTLKMSHDGSLEGPINFRVLRFIRPKKTCGGNCSSSADKRGFNAKSGKLVQIVSDGDNDLARYISELQYLRHSYD